MVPSAFVGYVLDNLAQKRTHLAVFRMWLDESASPECQAVLQTLVHNTLQMIDTLTEALRREGIRAPDPAPDPAMIREARKPPHSRACLHLAEQMLRRSLAWYEERLDQAAAHERPLWERLFLLERENWGAVQNALTA